MLRRDVTPGELGGLLADLERRGFWPLRQSSLVVALARGQRPIVAMVVSAVPALADRQLGELRRVQVRTGARALLARRAPGGIRYVDAWDGAPWDGGPEREVDGVPA